MISFSSVARASGTDPSEDQVLTDFTAASPDLGWFVVNDAVMGGRSEGGFESSGDGLRFTGRTNTNGGGFSSLRTEPMHLDLSKYAGIRLRVKGDGRAYTWRLTTDARWRGRQVSYWAGFETQKETWMSVDIPFSRFVPNFRGYRLDGPELKAGLITGMGIMIYDEQDGPFNLQLDSVSAYAASEPFDLSQFQWEKRLLVLSAPSAADPALNAQQSALYSSLAAFRSRDLVLINLLDSPEADANGRHLAPAEVADIRTRLGMSRGSFSLKLIGKDGSVKLSSDAVTPMENIYALIDTMPMRRAEAARRN